MSAAPWIAKYGQPKGKTQFGVRIAMHIMVLTKAKPKDALLMAGQAFDLLGIPYGHPAYAWDDDAARILALEFCEDQ